MVSWWMWVAAVQAAPVEWTVSARLLDAMGGPLDGTYDLTVSLYPTHTATAPVWREVHTGVTVDAGYVSVILGGQVPLDQSVLASPELWLGVAVGPDELSRERLLSVPYAHRSALTEAVPVGNVGSVACSRAGQVLYDDTAANLYVCNGTTWVSIGRTLLVEQGGVRQWSDGTVAASCEAYLRPTVSGYQYAGSTGDGLYRIDPDGPGGTPPLDAWCDMSTDGGGWTLVASVVGWSTFWDPSTYTNTTSARAVSIGVPNPSSNYVMHLESWRDLLAARGSNSELRLRVRRGDDGNVVTLGFLDGLQMGTDARFTNPTGARYGDGSPYPGAATGACVIQYNSDFQGTIVHAAFQQGDPACTGWMGWNGNCGYPSLGHDGHYYQTSASPTTPMFSHPCSLSLEYYCSANHVDGPTDNVSGCNYRAKWYWIR